MNDAGSREPNRDEDGDELSQSERDQVSANVSKDTPMKLEKQLRGVRGYFQCIIGEFRKSAHHIEKVLFDINKKSIKSYFVQ